MQVSALIRPRPMHALFAHRQGQALSANRFVADAVALAAVLPARGHVVNLCADRYRFAVGFAAALLRGQVSLLPPNHTPDFVARLAAHYPDVYALRDGDQAIALPIVDFPELPAAPASVEVPRVPDDRLAAIVFTSGSQGDPVPNRKYWGLLVQNAQAEARRLGVLDRHDLTIVGTVPSQHMYGFESAMLIAMLGGTSFDASKPFFPADVAAVLDAIDGPRALVTTPVHLRALINDGMALPPLEFVLCATAPLDPALAQAAEAAYGAPLYEIYGCTEAGQIATRRTTDGETWLTMDGLQLRTDGSTTYVSGGHVLGEVPLGDVIELHTPTEFRLCGRTADMINVAGKRTSLANLNHHLNAIEGVREGVIFLPEQAQGEAPRLAAFVVAPGLDAAAILHALRQRIDPVFLPRPLLFVDALPRNDTGKLPRAALLALYAKSHAGGRA